MTSFSWYSCLHIVRHLPSRMNCRRNRVSLDSFVLLVYLISRVRLVWFCNNIGLEGLIPWSGQDDEDENSEFSSSSSYPGVSEIPPLDYFFFNFIGKIPYFCVKNGIIHSHRDSWPEFSVIIHWQNKPFRTHTSKKKRSIRSSDIFRSVASEFGTSCGSSQTPTTL
jgi:hypothetical protein